MWDLSARSEISGKIACGCAKVNATGLMKTAPPPGASTTWHEDPRLAMVEVIDKWLKKPDWWITLTFARPETTALTAVASLRSWLSRWRTADASATGHKPGRSPLSRLLWCVEMQSRGAAHIHALGVTGATVSTPHCKSCFARLGWRQDAWMWWVLKESWAVHHGWARVYPFDAARGGGVAGYVAKYMYKAGGDHGLWQEGTDF